MSDIIKHLNAIHACEEAVEWAEGRSLESMWNDCERADWLLWLAPKIEVDRKLVVLAACDCAETALKFIPEGEDRPRIAIETARAWCKGEATIAEVRRAAAAAYAAYAAAAADADADAAYADAAYAAAYAADATYAYADAAYVAAYADARKTSLKDQCQLVRKHIPFSVMEEAWEAKFNV